MPTHAALHIVFDLSPQRAAFDGEFDADRNHALGRYANFRGHTQIHDVVTQLRIHDRPQEVPYLFNARWRNPSLGHDYNLPLGYLITHEVGGTEGWSSSTVKTMITLTDTAATKVKQLLEAEGATDLALRVAVRPGGCSGYSYEMFFDGDISTDDQTLTFGDVRVVVDQASSQLLVGASLDYQDGLQDAGFKINNPSATRTCGCGNSFS